MSDALPAACEACGGTGFVILDRDGASLARLCSCRARRAIPTASAILEAARVPARYRECSFEGFQFWGSGEMQLMQAKTLATRYAEEYPLNKSGLLFMGQPGVGKTHLAVATLRYLALQKGAACLFVDVQDLLRSLQATFDRQSGLTELELLQPVLTAEVLVLDDLGGRQFSPWVEETLAHIVTTRYNERRSTLVTTNYLDAPPNPKTPTLADRIGPRVRSRLHELCQLVVVTGDDFRMHVNRSDIEIQRQQRALPRPEAGS